VAGKLVDIYDFPDGRLEIRWEDCLCLTLPSFPLDGSETVLIVQQEKLLKLAVSDYVDRIVDGRGLRQRVITQPTLSENGVTSRPRCLVI
jgi:hypothetical protein